MSNLYMCDLNEKGYPILVNCICGEQGTKKWLILHRRGCNRRRGAYNK